MRKYTRKQIQQLKVMMRSKEVFKKLIKKEIIKNKREGSQLLSRWNLKKV